MQTTTSQVQSRVKKWTVISSLKWQSGCDLNVHLAPAATSPTTKNLQVSFYLLGGGIIPATSGFRGSLSSGLPLFSPPFFVALIAACIPPSLFPSIHILFKDCPGSGRNYHLQRRRKRVPRQEGVSTSEGCTKMVPNMISHRR